MGGYALDATTRAFAASLQGLQVANPLRGLRLPQTQQSPRFMARALKAATFSVLERGIYRQTSSQGSNPPAAMVSRISARSAMSFWTSGSGAPVSRRTAK